MRKSFSKVLGKIAALAAVSTVALTACGDGIVAEGQVDGQETYTFTMAAGALEGTPHSAIEHQYLDLLEERSDGRIQFERTSFEGLCNMNEIANCISDGRADIGTVVSDYTPNLLPSMSVVSIPFLNTDIQATTGALYEMHTEYEPAIDLLDSNDLHYIVSWPVGSLFIGSTRPVENLDDLEGLRARAAGPVVQETLESADVNVNSITVAETYESIQRGVIDSVAGALDLAVNFQIIEQLPYWADPGLGQYTAYNMLWSKPAYESLPEDLREIVDQTTEEFNAGTAVETYNSEMRNVCDGMLESSDVESFIQWDDADMEDWREIAAPEAESLWLDIADGYGFAEAEDYLAEYKSAYESHTSEDNPLDAGLSCVEEWQALQG